MTPLPDNLMTALRNLAKKSAGQDVPWINIADARALTDLGLAERTPSGWVITAQGEGVVKGEPEVGGTTGAVRLAP